MADLDPVKRMVCSAVQHATVTGKGRPALSGRPDEVVAVTGEVISRLVTLVTVDLANGTQRAFSVKVNETTPAPREGETG